MRARVAMRLALAACLFAGLVAGRSAFGDAGTTEKPDWWEVNRDIAILLMDQKTPLTDVLAKATAAKPKTAREAMFNISIFLRAGMNREAIEAVADLKRLCPRLDQVTSMYLDACDQYAAWSVAQSLVETFADNMSQSCLEDRLLKHLLASGWSVEKVDQWLAAMPAGVNNFWIKERLRFNVAHGRGKQLVQELTGRIKTNPRDSNGAIALLDGLLNLPNRDGDHWNLSWMAETVRPQSATDAEALASRLKQLRNESAAVTFYRQAIETPLTDKDDKELERREMLYALSIRGRPKQLRSTFAVRAREELAECLSRSGTNKEAQKWIAEAIDIRQKNGLGPSDRFGGPRQTAESNKERKTLSENDPEYWRKRAESYRGSRLAQEEEALKKGLALTPLLPKSDQTTQQAEWRRSSMLGDYVFFLKRANRTEEAVALLRKEIEQAPPASRSAEGAARSFAYDFSKWLNMDDEVLWTWLANRPKWGYTEERLLWEMLRRQQERLPWDRRRDHSENTDLAPYFRRAESLVKEKDPSRASKLGFILNRMGFAQRSIPWLEYAVEHLQERDPQERDAKASAEFALFESFLDVGDWRRAEQIFPLAGKRLGSKEIPPWYSRIAVLAAKAGAKTDALRIWKTVANLNPSYLENLRDLAQAGLKDELADFYRDMQRQMPSSEIPARAQRVLEASGNGVSTM